MKRGIISQSVAFSALGAGRRTERDTAKRFAVYRRNKNGELAKVPSVLCETMLEAEDTARRMEELNPGKVFFALVRA